MSNMKPEAQRIAIAEACGWNNKGVPGGHYKRADGGWTYGIDVLTDLNAMHEAEKVLPSNGLIDKYHRLLQSMTNNADQIHADRCWHATAAQRAEAFLKTLNLWTTK